MPPSASKSKNSSEKKVEFVDIPTDVMGIIAKKLDQKDIRSLASTSRTVARDVKKVSDDIYRDKLLLEYGVADWKGAYEMLDYMATKNPLDSFHIYKVNLRKFKKCPLPVTAHSALTRMVNEWHNTNNVRPNVNDTSTAAALIRNKKLYGMIRVFVFIEKCLNDLISSREQLPNAPNLFKTMFDKLNSLTTDEIPNSVLSGFKIDKTLIKESNEIAARLLPKLRALM